MLYIKSLEQAVPVFKALGSDIRIRLIQTLLEHQEMNMNELASSLGITNGALTSHVKKLEESGILAILPEHSGHGNQKVCRINVDKILVDIASNNDSPAEDSYSIDIPIGNYFNYSVYPTCGLSTTDNLIGEVDDPRYFAHPSHVDAKILWFGRGFIDYRIPNMLPYGPMFYDEDTVTDQPQRQIVAEIIREKALHALDAEIPHGIAVAIDRMKTRPGKNPIVDIDATIICERESHKGIIIGKQGAMLKKIGSNARYEIERMLESKVNLKLWVKVKKDWRDSDFLIKNFGYDKKEI